MEKFKVGDLVIIKDRYYFDNFREIGAIGVVTEAHEEGSMVMVGWSPKENSETHSGFHLYYSNKVLEKFVNK